MGRMLKTIDAVIDALGGTFKAASAVGVGPSAISMWKTRGRIPSDRYFVIQDALRKHGSKDAASPDLFGFAEAGK